MKKRNFSYFFNWVLRCKSIFTHPNLTPYRTAVPLTPSDCIHSPILHLTVHLSHSLRQFVFTAQSYTLQYTCPTHSVSLYSQPNLTPYRTAVPLTPSVCIHSPILHLTVQLFHSLGQFLFRAQSNNLPYNCPLTRSVFIHSPI